MHRGVYLTQREPADLSCIRHDQRHQPAVLLEQGKLFNDRLGNIHGLNFIGRNVLASLGDDEVL